MPGVRLTLGTREPMKPAIIKATPSGLLPTEAVVRIGVAEIRGSAKALRELAVAAAKAADLADADHREHGTGVGW